MLVKNVAVKILLENPEVDKPQGLTAGPVE
jgi:hypothetical protein